MTQYPLTLSLVSLVSSAPVATSSQAELKWAVIPTVTCAVNRVYRNTSSTGQTSTLRSRNVHSFVTGVSFVSVSYVIQTWFTVDLKSLKDNLLFQVLASVQSISELWRIATCTNQLAPLWPLWLVKVNSMIAS